MQAKIENKHGLITIPLDVLANLIGYAATGCYGVVGMVSGNKTDGIVRLLRKDSMDKGVSVTLSDDDRLIVDLHIMVEYGTNIPAISESIKNRVNYFIAETTGFVIEAVNVNVDGIRTEK